MAGRMQLFRRAFTSRICDHHLFYPSLYIPGNVLHPSPALRATSFSTYNHHLNPLTSDCSLTGQGVSGGVPTCSLYPRGRPSKASRGILFSYSLGSDSPTSLTNFQCLLPPHRPIRRIHPRFHTPERAFKSTKILRPVRARTDPFSLVQLRAIGTSPSPRSPFHLRLPHEKHGRPPRPPRDRFFPRTIYSFTFYSHRAFDSRGSGRREEATPG